MKTFPFLLFAALTLGGCSSNKASDPQPAPAVAPPAAPVNATQALLLGKWTLDTQVFATQPSQSASQTFGALYSYDHTPNLATTFEFKADGSAAFLAGPTTNQPGPSPSATGTYKVVGDMTLPNTASNLYWNPGTVQIIAITVLNATNLVLMKRTFLTSGVVNSEYLQFVR